jgi:hypothetical protein
MTNKAESELRRFLRDHRTAEDDRRKTHSVFDKGLLVNVGGPFRITDREKNKFYELYSRAYHSGIRLTMIELKPSRKWPFFLDLDGKPETTPIINKFIEPIKRALVEVIIPRTIEFAFGSRKFETVLQCKANNPMRCHLFLEPLTVIVLDTETAQIVRRFLIRACMEWSKSALPQSIPEAELNHFIDKIMQNQVGLRMYGSFKPKDLSDVSYVQKGYPVSVDSLHRFSIQPVGIAKMSVTKLTARITRWYKSEQSD